MPDDGVTGTSHFDTEVSQVATVKQLTASRYQVTMTESELVLVKNALAEAERVSRFGMEVLEDVDKSPRAAKPSENSRLRREIEALAMREASLRSLQKTMAEVDPRAKPAPMQHADLDQLSSGAALQVPPSR
jgi:DNA repair exonuclease SbcCD ATPase subunit